ncbi:MbeB family mobilization protein [Vibrio metschnikovii]|nr:MbeB family mobilization protein [Vibrio parahaemolyticus]EKO3674629.1 MbeB family mobilization protein [Vibrio metschnikovii]EKO3698683.1 MbeB family mobilization protein [Vibrio metschnikovii]EKO3722550.1 MbeB family mobilization protein [Vibrio metschnikovii]HBN6297057.1 MbeB family mobilization protein [Vibrio parahaemolyticus]
MSKILDMAKGFNEQSKKQANAIEQQLKQDFKKHEARIQAALNESEQRITSDINAQNARLSRLTLKTWIWLPVTVITVLIACWGVIWWQGVTIAQNQQEISRQQENLEKLNAKTWGIRFFQDKEGRYIVIPEGYTVKGGWTLNDGQNELIKLVEK